MTSLHPLKSMLLILLALALTDSRASAQFGGNRINRPIDTPTFSPYLNMFRGGGAEGGATQNYFGLVRPQQNFAQQNQQLGQGLQALQMQQMQGMQMMPGAGAYGYSQLGTTGHPVAFNSFRTSHFTGGSRASWVAVVVLAVVVLAVVVLEVAVLEVAVLEVAVLEVAVGSVVVE